MVKVLRLHQQTSERLAGDASVAGWWKVESGLLQRHSVTSRGLHFSQLAYLGDRRGCASAAACWLNVGGLEIVCSAARVKTSHVRLLLVPPTRWHATDISRVRDC